MRRGLQIAAVCWAFVGAAIALVFWLPSVNADARLVGGVMSVGGPLAALAASRFLARGADRTAGLLLVLSVVTPTGFAYVLNLPALFVGLALLLAPTAVLRDGGRGAVSPRGEHTSHIQA